MRALVQLRGEVNQSQAVRDTLTMLNLGTVNHATLVPETDAYRGMVTKVNDWVAHGQPSLETVDRLVRRRAEPKEGDATVDDEWVAEHTDYDDVDALVQALYTEETSLQAAGLAPVFRLHPPRGGHDGIKHPTREAGQLGKHTTEEIDDLLTAMR